MTSKHDRRLAYSDPRESGAKRIALMASTVAFEFNKATLKIRRSLHISPATSPKLSRKASKITPPSTQSTSRGSKRNRQLCAELSSFALYPIFGALTPTRFSSPNLLFQNEKKPSTSMMELANEDFYLIMQNLDANSLRSFSQTCQRLRSLCIFHEGSLPKQNVSSHEIVISFNQVKRRTEVRLLKKERTRNDEAIVSSKISSVLSMFTRALTKVTFETSVFLSDWIDEIIRLHDNHKLVPLALSFTGGSLTKGNQLNGADLRCISENEFIEFVKKLQPHLQEVQLQTSRYFETALEEQPIPDSDSSPPRLLGLISILSNFGIVYERPQLRFFFDDIEKVIAFWKNNVLSRSCDVYIKRPRDACVENWKKLGTIDEFRVDPTTDEVLVMKLTIKHSFLVHIDLIFHFH